MRVGVIGAGITGLAVTHYLTKRGVEVATFEADTEPGGVVRSNRVDGRLLEYGPQRIRLTPAVANLVDDLGLHNELLKADNSLPLYIYADDALRQFPLSLSSFLRTDLLSWRGKLRILTEPVFKPASSDELAADLFRRKFGDEAYRSIVEPLFGGIYGSDPAKMPAEYSLSRLIALEKRKGSFLRAAVDRLKHSDDTSPPVSFVDGLQVLPEALYEKHHPYVHLNTPVDRIYSRDDGEGFLLDTGGQTLNVDTIVMTVPASAAVVLLNEIDTATADPLGNLAYNSLVLVHLYAETNAEGFGYQVQRNEPLETLGVTWNDSLFSRDGVYTVFLGGMYNPAAIDRSDGTLGRIAQREFQNVMNVDSEVLSVTRLPRVLPAYDTTWTALDDTDLPEGIILATNYTGRIGIPSRIREAKEIAEQVAKDA